MITICVKLEVFFVAGPMGAERVMVRADSEEFPQAASRVGQTGIDCQLPKRRASKHRVRAVQRAEMGGLTPSSEVMAGTVAAYVRVIGRFDV
jgi:hypothetical protein